MDEHRHDGHHQFFQSHIMRVEAVATLIEAIATLRWRVAWASLCRAPFASEAVGLDLVTVSSNDLYGPPGAGALWVRQGIKILPQMLGGGQEGGYRSGTENLPALVGFGVAFGGHVLADRIAPPRDTHSESNG